MQGVLRSEKGEHRREQHSPNGYRGSDVQGLRVHVPAISLSCSFFLLRALVAMAALDC